MKITRRDALKLGLVGTGTLLSPFGFIETAEAAAKEEDKCNQCSSDMLAPSTDTSPLSPKFTPFEQPLPILKALKPTNYNNKPIDYYDITMQKTKIPLVPAKDGKPAIKAEFWTYNGIMPGPLIRQQKERQSCIRFTNHLGNDDKGKEICASIHLHGMASLPQYDGYAQDLMPVNYYKDYYYPNNRASILWYHDHAVHKTSRNVYMGLAGMYIVEYAKEDFCDPKNFGCLPKDEFEIPLIIQDKIFKQPKEGDQGDPNEWKLIFNDRGQRGVYADVILVNGVPYPHLKVKRRKYFFRILNASASRTYQLTLSGDATRMTTEADNLTKNKQKVQLTVVGSDAGLLAHPVDLIAPNQFLRMGIAERYGVVIDFSVFRPEVKSVFLRNQLFSSNLGPHSPALMRFDLEDGEVEDPSFIPNPLGIVTLQEELTKRATQTRTFRFGRSGEWKINNKVWDPQQVEAKPELCGIEIWNLVNLGGWVHPVHIHLIDFQILDRNGRPPLEYEKGWKDVVLLNELETVRVIAKFAPHRGKYMMHCHNLIHEDHDMMNQFEVVEHRKVTETVNGVTIEKIVEITGSDPCSDPAQPLPAKPLGSLPPPKIDPVQLPCKCLEPLKTNSCQIPPPPIPPECKFG